ncbi:MAG: hypothetical protein CK425_10700 [Parachlamydia sp.]|nr:MAG: hypothetical protein CK425_10700 [Parachlamydia sp.]
MDEMLHSSSQARDYAIFRSRLALNSVIRLVETLKNELGHENFVQIMRQAFGPFFDSPILEPVI